MNYKDIYDCVLCNNTGIIGSINPSMGSICSCHNKRKALVALEKSGLKGQLESYTFDNFTTDEEFQKQMKSKALKFVEQSKGSFYISGQTGSGKTHLGTAMCGEFLDKGKGVIYKIFDEMMIDLKSNVNDISAYEQILYRLCSCTVLYIDDFMKFTPSEADLKHTKLVIDRRVNKITIISSEKSIDEIIAIDEALGGRLKQQCGEFTLNVADKEGRNYRLKGER